MDINRLAEVLEEVVKRLDQTQNKKNKLDHVLELLNTVQNYIEGVKDKLERLDQKTDFIKTKIVETRDKSSSEAEIKDWRKLQGEIEQVKTSITSLAGHLGTVRNSIATVLQKIDSVKISLNDGHKTVKVLKKNMATVVQNINSVKKYPNDGHKTVKVLKKNMATVVQNINSVKKYPNDGHKTVKEDLEKCMSTVVQKINSMKTSLNDGHKTVIENLLSLKQGQDLVTTKIEQSANEVKDDIYRSKRDIFAVTEKEAQIVRDRIEGPLSSLGRYSFDFYVENLKTLVMSAKDVYSPSWDINEAKTSMAGYVASLADGNIHEGFIYGRHPREVGLQPRPAWRLKVKATICDVSNRVLPDIVVGEIPQDMNETGISSNDDCGWSLGVTSCDDLMNKGYGRREGYWRGTILTRYDVTVQ